MKDFKTVALNKKGQFGSAVWERPCKTLKNCDSIITKVTTAKNIRFGCAYDNLKDTIEKRESGELPSENQGLRGMEWKVFPVVLKSLKTEKEYIRLETAQNSAFTTKYYINGVETDKKSIEQFLQASEKKSGETPSIMNIAVDYIKELN